MSQDQAGFPWTDKSNDAARLLAEDESSDEEIAARVGVSRRTLARWKLHPDFAARVESIVEAHRRAILGKGIADRGRRVQALQDRWLRMKRVVEERAASPEMAAVPGGSTGLLVHTVKGVGRGEDFRLVDLYEVDVGLLKEFREHEKQAAQELGQWTEKREISGDPDRPPIVKILKGVTMDDL